MSMKLVSDNLEGTSLPPGVFLSPSRTAAYVYYLRIPSSMTLDSKLLSIRIFDI